jgi:hypothetical protein
MTTFTSYREVDAWVKANGADALREQLRSGRLRSIARFWSATWLWRHEPPRVPAAASRPRLHRVGNGRWE